VPENAKILLHHARLPAELDPVVERRWLERLPAARAAAIARRQSPADRVAALAGVVLLVSCAIERGDATVPLGRLEFPQGGKPSWPGGPDFSISHAAGRAGCAVAPPGIAVGFDLEARGAATGETLRHVARDEELLLYEDAGLTPTDLWVAKEAVVKAAGVGVARAQAARLTLDSATLDGRHFVLLRPFIADDVVAALAASGEAAVGVREVSLETLLAAGPG